VTGVPGAKSESCRIRTASVSPGPSSAPRSAICWRRNRRQTARGLQRAQDRGAVEDLDRVGLGRLAQRDLRAPTSCRRPAPRAALPADRQVARHPAARMRLLDMHDREGDQPAALGRELLLHEDLVGHRPRCRARRATTPRGRPRERAIGSGATPPSSTTMVPPPAPDPRWPIRSRAGRAGAGSAGTAPAREARPCPPAGSPTRPGAPSSAKALAPSKSWTSGTLCSVTPGIRSPAASRIDPRHRPGRQRREQRADEGRPVDGGQQRKAALRRAAPDRRRARPRPRTWPRTRHDAPAPIPRSAAGPSERLHRPQHDRRVMVVRRGVPGGRSWMARSSSTASTRRASPSLTVVSRNGIERPS
jgi:hypothetical protein